MPATIFTTVSSFEMVGFCEHNEAVFHVEQFVLIFFTFLVLFLISHC